MTTTTADYRIALTYEDTLKLAKELAAANPDGITRHAYFIEGTHSGRRTYCIVAKILEAAGFNASPEWWEAKRHNGEGLYFSASKRLNSHIRFLTDELFSNQDLDRDAFLTTLQSRQDNGTVWSRAVRNSESFVTRINARNPQR